MEDAVNVTDAYKSYGATSVLRGLNMTVPSGSIYGLLGPSGCGKTTLLSGIVGRMKLDSGRVQLAAKTKADIGYMPQEIALHEAMTMEETFYFYGRHFSLSRAEILDRVNELTELLNLPRKESVISKLSGGQQRRVSFAVTLLHNPELLILDEPTVGLDPVLRDTIWNHFIKLTADQGKTIILTTHYIEEASQAQCVGLMREGVLMAEKSPSQLMQEHGSSSLEYVFLELCQKQQALTVTTSESSPPSQAVTNLRPEVKYPDHLRDQMQSANLNCSCFNWSRFSAHTIKNALFMWRTKAIMLFILSLPLFICVIFFLAINVDIGKFGVAVVDEELAFGLRGCTKRLGSGCGMDDHETLSCRYVEQIRLSGIKVKEFRDLESAKDSVRRNDAWAVLYFGANYTANLFERIIEGKDTYEDVVELSEVNIWMDMSNQLISNLVRTQLVVSYVDFIQDVFRDCGWPPDAADIPIKINDPVYGAKFPKFADFGAPALILVLAFFMPVVFTVAAILQEKMTGSLERNMVAGSTLLEIVVAHCVVQFGVLLVQIANMMIVLYVVFQTPFEGSFIGTTVLLIMEGISGMCYGLVVSTICDSMLSSSFLGTGTFLGLSAMAGMMWPVEGMHSTLKLIAPFVPLNYSTKAMRGLTSRGWPVTHPLVLKGYIASAVWTVLLITLTFALVRLKGVMR